MSDSVWLLWEWADDTAPDDFLIGIYATQDVVVRRHQEEGWNVRSVTPGTVRMDRDGIERYAYPLEVRS